MQKVLFIGGFGCGLRTLVNALLRKEVLNTSIGPTIDEGFVTQIVSGEGERCFALNKDGTKKILNFAELEEVIMDSRVVDTPLKNAEYIMYESSAQATNLVFIIADPCMGHINYKRGQYGQEILRFPCWQNDAVVYVLNASMPFTRDDKLYILENLAGNVNAFFCINRMEAVSEKDVPELKKYIKEMLKDVFTIDDAFDESLYQRRVFFISAYYSFNARLGKGLCTHFGKVKYVDDIYTGVPEFEYTLRKFLQQ